MWNNHTCIWNLDLKGQSHILLHPLPLRAYPVASWHTGYTLSACWITPSKGQRFAMYKSLSKHSVDNGNISENLNLGIPFKWTGMPVFLFSYKGLTEILYSRPITTATWLAWLGEHLSRRSRVWTPARPLLGVFLKMTEKKVLPL